MFRYQKKYFLVIEIISGKWINIDFFHKKHDKIMVDNNITLITKLFKFYQTYLKYKNECV